MKHFFYSSNGIVLLEEVVAFTAHKTLDPVKNRYEVILRAQLKNSKEPISVCGFFYNLTSGFQTEQKERICIAYAALLADIAAAIILGDRSILLGEMPEGGAISYQILEGEEAAIVLQERAKSTLEKLRNMVE